MPNILTLVYFFWFIAAVNSVGYMALRLLKVHLTQRVEKNIFAFATGCMIFSYIFILLGSLHMLYKQTLLFFYIVPLPFLFFWLFQRIKRKRVKRKLHFKPKLFEILPILILLFILIPDVPSLFLYPAAWDPLAYHLVLPKLYFSDHFFSFYRHFPQTGYPVAIEGLYAFGEIFKEPRFANILNFYFLLIIIVYMFFGLRYRFNSLVLFLATLIFAFRPMLYSELSVSPFIDYALILYGVLTAVTLEKFVLGQDKKYLILLIFFASFTLLVKYTGFIIVTALVITLAIFLNAKRMTLLSFMKKNIFSSKLYSALIILSFIPVTFWYIRTTILAGNPVYPFANTIFKGVDYDPAVSKSLVASIKSENWTIAQTARNFITRADTINDYSNLFLLVSLVILFLGLWHFISNKKNDFRYGALFIFIGLGITVLLLGPLERYYLLYIPLAIIISTQVFVTYLQRKKNILTSFFILLFIIGLLIQIDVVFYYRSRAYTERSKRVWLSGLQYNVAKKNLFAQDNYEVIDYVNKKLHKDRDRLLIVFDNRLYYYDIPAEFENPTINGYFTNPKTKSTQEIAKKLKSHGITHIVVNKNWGSYPTLREDLFEEFLAKHVKVIKETKNLYNPNGVTLYKIL